MNIVFRNVTKCFFLKVVFCPLFILVSESTFSQEITLKYSNKPLSEILLSMSDISGVQVSFDDTKLSEFRVSVNRKFNSPTAAIDYLIKDLPLAYDLINGVFIIYTVEIKPRVKNFFFAGQIFDSKTLETLPYAAVMINSTGIISDSKGNFSYTSATDSVFTLKISYLGYYILDTLVKTGTQHVFGLVPSIVALKEVVVEGSIVARNIETGSLPGVSRLNHKIALYLPGNGDNSVYNLLRLQSGILASGDHAGDIMVWGSYEGQSQIIFDGFTIYGLKNFNDNISAINPFMAKDIKVMKSIFGAEYGERVGGIIDITGIDGTRNKFSGILSINNNTLNSLLSIPAGKNSNLTAAIRKTYYNLYQPEEGTKTSTGRGRNGGGADYYITPDYHFHDFNLKYSGNNKKSDYFISLYNGADQFSYLFEQETPNYTASLDYDENNRQWGASVFYGYRWKQKFKTDFTAGYSFLENKHSSLYSVIRQSGNQNNYQQEERYNSVIEEFNLHNDSRLPITGNQRLDFGTGIIYYSSELNTDTSNFPFNANIENLVIPNFYFQDNYSPGKKFTIRPGLRADLHLLSAKLYLQPRFSVIYRLTESFRINAAAGVYNQFVSKNAIFDELGNMKFVWQICDNNENKVLQSEGTSMGLGYSRNNFSAGAEAYLKKTKNMTRYLESSTGISVFNGIGKTQGIDFFIKKDFRNQTIWASYTLSKTEEKFSYFPFNNYLPAMHDQRHELKVAGMFSYKSIRFSVNYVYGSGFPNPLQLPENVEYGSYYSRLDAGIVYNFTSSRLRADAGISVLNLLNRANVNYSNTTFVPADQFTQVSLYAEAVPFTPSLFLNIAF